MHFHQRQKKCRVAVPQKMAVYELFKIKVKIINALLKNIIEMQR